MKKVKKRSIGARVSAVLLAGALTLLILARAPSQTHAGWVDPEYASASVTTLTVPNISPRPTCTTEAVPGQPLRKTVLISWTAPSGGLPSGMLYEVRTTNTTANPNTTRSIFQTATSHRFDGGLFSGDVGWPNPPVTLSVQVLVVIPNSMTTPTAAVWESLSPLAPRTVSYTFVSAGRYSYVCTGV